MALRVFVIAPRLAGGQARVSVETIQRLEGAFDMASANTAMVLPIKCTLNAGS